MILIKIGGSLLYNSKDLLLALKEYASKNDKYIVIVPGGGVFANTVREVDKKLNLSSSLSHKLAIKSMDFVGEIYSELGDIKCYTTLFDLKKNIHNDKISIILPSNLLLSIDIAKHSWDITSDSLSLYIGKLLNVKDIIIATDVDGIYKNQKLLREVKASQLKEWTSVDIEFPKLLRKFKMTAYIFNGKHPERIIKFLNGENTIFTKVVP
ncbi:hypothetical protein ACPB8Q_01310 [Methanocaldococcus indicus]|uniref:amino acid kinase family protein n=1 Tax=Methanocaldococcus indicus TaxID=213231 RepID=UPI003C6D1245